MPSKGISFLNGKVENGIVYLSWYKTTPLFERNEQDEFSESCAMKVARAVLRTLGGSAGHAGNSPSFDSIQEINQIFNWSMIYVRN